MYFFIKSVLGCSLERVARTPKNVKNQASRSGAKCMRSRNTLREHNKI